MANLPSSLKPVDKDEVRAEISARQARPVNAVKAQRQLAESTLRGWLGIAADDRPRQAREQRQLDALAEPILASLVYRGGIMRQSLQRVARVVDSGLGEREQAELAATLAALQPAPDAFAMGRLRRVLARLPVVGSRYRRWSRRCAKADAELVQMAERMVLAREPFKHTIARLARVLGEVRELLDQLQEQLEFGRLLAQRLDLRRESDISAVQAAILDEMRAHLQRRLQLLDQRLNADRELVLAVEVLVRNARRLIGGQRQAVAAVRAALNPRVTEAGAEPAVEAVVQLFGLAREQLQALSGLRDEAMAEIVELCRDDAAQV